MVNKAGPQPGAQFSAGVKTDLSFAARVGQSISYVLSGVTPASWFGPLQPLKPFAPESVRGRAFDYDVGYNLNYTPRASEGVTFAEMRGLAEACDMLAIVIQTRLDQVGAQNWLVRCKPQGSLGKRVKETPEQRTRIDKITALLQSPDRELNWDQWCRALLYDHFVIDAPCIYLRPDRVGRLYSLELIDGATIKPLMDDSGRRPMAPDAAYQQVLKGVPAADYTTAQLLYRPQNVRTNKVYGYSRVEQVITTVNTSIRRALHNVEYYRSGSQPDAIAGVPEEWTQDQIKTFQDYWDLLLSGNSAERRKLRFVPGEFKYQETKDHPFKDEFDDYLSRVICFAFSVSPISLVKMANRASADSMHNQALEEGLMPTLKWVKSVLDPVIAGDLASPDLEFAWEDDREIDAKDQASIDVQYAQAGLMSVDEARERMGLDPQGGAAGNLMVLTANGYVPLDPAERQKMADDAAAKAAELNPPPAAGEGAAGVPPGKGGSPAKPGGASPPPAEKLAKVTAGFKVAAPANAPAGLRATARAAVAAKVATLLKTIAPTIATAVASQVTAMGKASGGHPVDAAMAAIDWSVFSIVAAVAAEQGATVAKAAGVEALATLGVDATSGLVNQVNERAAVRASERAASLVGKHITDAGAVVDNPNAKYRLDNATRDLLREEIAADLEAGLTGPELRQAIMDGFAFSQERADLIAKTEIATANSYGALAGYEQAAAATGLTIRKAWLPDANACDICQGNADAGAIPLEDDFPSGDGAPVAHPHCECALVSAVEEDSGE